MKKLIASGAVAIVLSGVAALPAQADDYPPTTNGGTIPSSTGSGGQVTPTSTVTDQGDLARTGSGAATVGLLVGLIALGAGTGIVVASRRRGN